ncbi:hypothetical protein KR054_002641 [Drosophila jambulina]|nr:hypothetical protein KR054_002641 [Drosophila jambulina]
MAPNKKKAKVPKSQAIVPRFCQRVIDDVVTNMRQAFLDDGVGEQALQRMLHMWRSKMMSSESIDLSPAIPPPQDMEEDLDQEPCSSSSMASVYAKQEICKSAGTAWQLDGTLDERDSVSIKQEICQTIDTARQLDGTLDDSDEEDDENELTYNEADEELEEEAENSETEAEGVQEEPLNSGDDLTDDEEIEEKFESENLVACQYDVVSRSRNKWKFIFRDGMMKVHGKEFVFKRAEGDAVW